MSWNVQSWTQSNRHVRETVLLQLDPDIICLSETHLRDNDTIELTGYTWLSHNRQSLHRRARTGSGGCGILVKDSLLTQFTYNIIDNTIEGLLGVKFTNKITDFTFVVYSCYLPPESSERGRDSIAYYAHLLSDMYFHDDCDMIFIAGDLNSRLGTILDYIPDVDTIQGREVIDSTKNSHGESLAEFLKDSKCCTLHGRVKPELNNYTFMSHLGKSVNDHMIVNHNSLQHFYKCEVITRNECIEKFDLFHLLSQTCKLSDHSVLVAEMTCSFADVMRMHNNDGGVDSTGNENPPKYKLQNIPDAFMNTGVWYTCLNQLIHHFENCHNEQQEIDNSYKLFCDNVFREMDKYLDVSNSSKGVKKKFKYFKPYWNDHLTNLWAIMRNNERDFKRVKNISRQQNQQCYRAFINSQNLFDRELRKAERRYNRGFCIELDEIDTSNPREFWKSIKKLGPKSKKDIPMKVYRDGDLTSNTDHVLSAWKHDFHSLYNKVIVENETYQEMIHRKEQLEESMRESNYRENEFINFDITFEEVEKVVNRLKYRKAVGIDGIPNEIIKQSSIITLLSVYFNKCFQYAKVPTVWLKAVISPIPKSATKDPYVPLNYRAISLLSCVYKAYSGVLNNRIVNYLEDLNWFVEEQNGFRKKRSCQDHLFTLTSIIRNRQHENLSTFAAFIDFEKAFDWVNRDMLLYKLLLNNIDGKIYNAIKVMYTNTESCIRLNNCKTDWFKCLSGVRQGDVLSTTLFSIFINDLALDVKNTNIRIPVDSGKVSILLYADDIVLLAENEHDLQILLDTIFSWCKTWYMNVNEKKTKIVHFRKKNCVRTNFVFKYGLDYIEIVSQYKYLGITLHEYLDFKFTMDELSDAAGRALGAVIAKTKHLKDIGYNTYTKLFDTGVYQF